MRPNRILCLCLCCLYAALAGAAGAPDTGIQVKGIVATPKLKLALFEYSQARPFSRQFSLLAEGEREENLEVLKIESQAGSVRISRQGEETQLRLEGGPATPSPAPALQLEQAGLEAVSSLYQRLSGRTLLRPSGLPKLELDLRSSATTEEGLADAMVAALAEKGVFVRTAR